MFCWWVLGAVSFSYLYCTSLSIFVFPHCIFTSVSIRVYWFLFSVIFLVLFICFLEFVSCFILIFSPHVLCPVLHPAFVCFPIMVIVCHPALLVYLVCVFSPLSWTIRLCCFCEHCSHKSSWFPVFLRPFWSFFVWDLLQVFLIDLCIKPYLTGLYS